MTIRSLFPALALMTMAACSEPAETPEDARDPAGQDAPTPAENAAAAPPEETPSEPAREVLSGDVSSLALDMEPAIAMMVEEDGRSMVLEIRTDSLDAVQDSWGGVGTPMRLDCERGEPFTGDDGETYEYYADCRLP